MMTRQEERDEFWLLTNGVLQDSTIDPQEARVIMRWLEEHQKSDEFQRQIDRIHRFLDDQVINYTESKAIIESIGTILRTLRTSAGTQG